MCATCEKDWFFGGSPPKCKRCGSAKLSPVAAVIIFSLAMIAIFFFIYRRFAKRHSRTLMRQLKVMRKRLREVRRKEREAQRAAQRAQRKRRATHRVVAGLGGLAKRAKRFSLCAVHDGVRAARDGMSGFGGETTRILLNAFKVYSHLYESLVFCVHWPVEILQNTFFRSNALHCTATARILIPAECSAVS